MKLLKNAPETAENNYETLPPLSEFKIRWKVLISLVALHLGAVAAFFFVTPAAVITAVALWIAVGILGVTVGYHRLCTHQAFATYDWVKYVHLAFAAISLQQGPISWVRIHRQHHQKSDTFQDPHPQKYGFWYGHCGWTFLSHKVLGRTKGLQTIPSNLKNDKVVMMFERYHLHFFILSLVALYAIGGLPMVLWAGAVRTVGSLHAAWSVNSLGHRFGYRNYETKDDATNNALVAFFTFGEGWHNNHHRFPMSARHGLRWFEIDMSWYWIKFLNKIGLAWDLKEPAHELRIVNPRGAEPKSPVVRFMRPRSLPTFLLPNNGGLDFGYDSARA